ncbi:RlpA-like double-psi beta-barrel-protein domain-containing protein-containing protein [Dissophora ornata]|nr:RlpA-like double-psi beta-barrel-protein domain-containing protein-containing protein [Dissophora ornata]
MVKFTPAAFVALAIAAISSAAPIASPTASPSPSVTALDVPVNVASDAEVKVASSVDEFSSSIQYTGKATWFTDSYGACNINWDGETQPIVALNAHQMGTESWGNPACGRTVQIVNKSNGKTVLAQIVDKCPGDQCAFGSLDLSPAAFKQIGSLSTGILNIDWHYV